VHRSAAAGSGTGGGALVRPGCARGRLFLPALTPAVRPSPSSHCKGKQRVHPRCLRHPRAGGFAPYVAKPEGVRKQAAPHQGSFYQQREEGMRGVSWWMGYGL